MRPFCNISWTAMLQYGAAVMYCTNARTTELDRGWIICNYITLGTMIRCCKANTPLSLALLML